MSSKPLPTRVRRCISSAAIALAAWLPALPGQAQFPEELVVDAAGFLGATYTGADRIRGAGGAVAAAGDVNADGKPDLIIGCPGLPGLPGRAFVVLGGQRAPLKRDLSVPAEGIVPLAGGARAGNGFGYFVAGAGDVDGDGIDDVLVGLPGGADALVSPGAVLLVFGDAQLRAVEELPGDGARAVVFTQDDTAGTLGLAGAGVGDINADGFGDLVLGIPDAPAVPAMLPPRTAGRVRVVFGGPHLRHGAHRLHLDGPGAPAGVDIGGADAGSELGAAVAGAGDFDLDGMPDIALGAPGQAQNGAVFVVHGGPALPALIDLAAAPASRRIELRSTLVGSRLGASVAGGLDATGDGESDLLAGAPAALRDGGAAGAAMLVPGSARFRGLALAFVPGSAAELYRGGLESQAGSAAGMIPDLSGDGIAELLIGSPGAFGGKGAAHLVYGGAAEPGNAFFLEQLRGGRAASFRASTAGARLGAAVAGLPDRNGDRRGDIALGAPAFPLRDAPGAGAAFEVGVPPDLQSPAPRNLKATLAAGGRVKLTWTIARVYRAQRVYRDGVPIDGSLPGHWQQFVDVSPGRGKHVYVVEADQDPDLRSNLAEVEVRALPVRELACKQVEGQLRVRVAWSNSDAYDSIAVVVDGRRIAELGPEATSHEFDAAPGEHTVEVFDPAGSPTGERARCSVRVVAAELPAVDAFTCVLDGARSVRLTWAANAAYSAYFLQRNGIPVAKLSGDTSSHVDAGVPAGPQRYVLVGLSAENHAGPGATCEVMVPQLGGAILRGRVEWAGGGAVRAGTVQVSDDATGELLGPPVQVSSLGRFEAAVPRRDRYRLLHEAVIDGARLACGIEVATLRVHVTAAATSLAEDALVLVPPPVFLVAAPGAESPTQAPAARWRALRAHLDRRVFHFALVLPAGVARGAYYLARSIDEVKGHLARELGGAPLSVDVVAYGSAGLAARAFLAGVHGEPIRRLVLLGTPNLGTTRGHLEARTELAGRQPGSAGPADCAGSGGPFVFSTAAEQTQEFLAELNVRIAVPRSAEIHVVAGTAGLAVLDQVLECDSHDNRVCESSALGGVAGAIPHRVGEDHETLGRGAESVALVAALLDAQDAPVGRGGGGPAAEGVGGGAGEGTHPSGNIYSGVLEPGGLGDFPLISDTSESIIIILNTDEPGGVQFKVRTPSGKVIDPPAAGALSDVEYQTYGDGEGHIIQAYRFLPGELGVYVAQLENPVDNDAIQYSLEAYVESGLVLEAHAEPTEIGLQETALVEALLTRLGQPELDATLEARVWRPNGDLEIVALADGGTAGDAAAGDGIYSVLLTSAAQPGIHQVEIAASKSAGQVVLFQRETSTRFQVRSDLIELTGELTSGTADHDLDQVLDSLFVDAQVRSFGSGIFLLTGRLTDLHGDLVAEGGTMFSLTGAQVAPVRVYFAGSDIFRSRKDGPYVLGEVRLFDGTAGFVEADRRVNAHQTGAMGWNAFGLAAGAPFVRADANGDGRVDISDAIAILEYLFNGTQDLGCLDAADANADAELGLSDAVLTLEFLFAGRAAIPSPHPGCARDHRIGCTNYPGCD